MALEEKKEGNRKQKPEGFFFGQETKDSDNFGETKKEFRPKKTGPEGIFSSLNEQVNALLMSVRILEERYSNLRKKTQVTDQNMLEGVKKITTEINLLNSDIYEMRKQLLEANEKINLLFEQIKVSVKKEDLDILDKYLNMWEPMRYITYNEAVKMIKESMGKVNKEDKQRE